MGERSFIVTQSIKKLPAEVREWALDKKGVRRLSDDSPVDLSRLREEDRRAETGIGIFQQYIAAAGGAEKNELCRDKRTGGCACL